MKKIIIITLLVLTSCNSLKKHQDSINFKITNENIETGKNLELIIINNGDFPVYMTLNTEFEFELSNCSNHLRKNISETRMIVSDKNNELPKINILTKEYSLNSDNQKSRIKKDTLKLIKINKKVDTIIRRKFVSNLMDYNGFEYKYIFEKEGKYFVRVEYFPNKKIIDSLRRKGIKVYNKRIVSNKIPIKF